MVFGRHAYTILVLYFPPRPAGAVPTSYAVAVRDLVLWGRSVLDQVRGRSTPLILVDLNALLGMQLVGHEWHVGAAEAVLCGFCGAAFGGARSLGQGTG